VIDAGGRVRVRLAKRLMFDESVGERVELVAVFPDKAGHLSHAAPRRFTEQFAQRTISSELVARGARGGAGSALAA
jgi:hypothetical protein